MKILTIVLLSLTMFMGFNLLPQKYPEVSVFFTTKNANGEITSTSVTQQRTDGSKSIKSNYFYAGKFTGSSSELMLAGDGVYSLRPDANYYNEPYILLPFETKKQPVGKILGYDVYFNKARDNTKFYYSSELDMLLKIESPDGTIYEATKVLNKIDPADFVLPNKPTNYDFFMDYLDNMEDKELSSKLKEQYLPKGYSRIHEKKICDAKDK